jgi:hypothetical protein
MTGNHWFLLTKHYAFDDELQTREPDEVLKAHFDLRWRRVGGSKRIYKPHPAIREYVRRHAGRISAEESIIRYHWIEDRINSAMGTSHDICGSAIRLLWANVRFLEVDEDLIVRARERERLRIEAVRREQEQKAEIRHIDAFRSQVLSDPGMALAYWFMRHPDHVGRDALDTIEDFAQRIASYDPNNRWVKISRVMQAFVDNLTESERRQSIEILRFWMTRHGMNGLAGGLPQDDDEI